jgi:hypothetical protein
VCVANVRSLLIGTVALCGHEMDRVINPGTLPLQDNSQQAKRRLTQAYSQGEVGYGILVVLTLQTPGQGNIGHSADINIIPLIGSGVKHLSIFNCAQQ